MLHPMSAAIPSHLPPLIALCGNARHGKDTIADHLADRYGYRKLHLATPLKLAVNVMFGWPQTVDKELVDPRWGISPRQAYQALGTEFSQFTLPTMFSDFGTITGRNLWVKRIMAEIASTSRPVVVADVRFPHEAEQLAAVGGVIVRVVRDCVAVDRSHPSEAGVDLINIDHFIDNDASFSSLYEKVDTLVESLRRKRKDQLGQKDAADVTVL